jgi:hypothetical protein
VGTSDEGVGVDTDKVGVDPDKLMEFVFKAVDTLQPVFQARP